MSKQDVYNICYVRVYIYIDVSLEFGPHVVLDR